MLIYGQGGRGLEGTESIYGHGGRGLKDCDHIWAWGRVLKETGSIYGHGGGALEGDDPIYGYGGGACDHIWACRRGIEGPYKGAIGPYMSITPPTGSPDWCPAARPAPFCLQAPPPVPGSLSLCIRPPRPIRRQGGPRSTLRPIGGAAGQGKPRPFGRIHLSVSATPPS